MKGEALFDSTKKDSKGGVCLRLRGPARLCCALPFSFIIYCLVSMNRRLSLVSMDQDIDIKIVLLIVMFAL